MSLNDFEIIKRLGEGAYSSVYHVRRIADGEYYALKKVRMQKLSDKEKENALNEVRILASIKHPNIVAYREAFIDEPSQSLCIVMEYADSGDLFQQICDHQKNNTLFKEDDIWKMFIQMVRGLRCLHEIMIFHRDLKSANVFLNKDGSAKLGDMNVSKVAKKGMLYTQTGTPYYASPEVWRDQPYDNKSDIWSLGCVLYESITLKPPFRADDMQGLYKKVLRGVYPKIPNVYSSDLANLVKSLIQVTPQMRPSCDRILEMPIVRKRIEKLFPTEEFNESQSSLLNTIRVPKNLLYLTDRLPKPSYESPTQKRKMDEEERIRRRTHDAGNMLPEIKHKKSGKIVGDTASQQTQVSSQVAKDGKRSRRQNTKPTVTTRGRSDMRDSSQLQEGYTGDDGTKVGASSHIEDDRKSVVSKSSVTQAQQQIVQPLSKETSIIRKNSTKRSQNNVVSHRVKEHHSIERKRVNDDYEDDQFEREDISPPPKASIALTSHVDDKESSYLHETPNQSSPGQQLQHSSVSPITKRSNKILQPSHGQNPSAQMMLMQNRPQINYSVNPSGGAPIPQIERIYIQKGPPPLPSLVDGGNNHQSKKNLAYINISGEGAKPVGYLGLKKAEKDLIMRRYKYNHHVSDHIQRVAMIYGQNGNGQHTNQYSYNYGGPSSQNIIYSPYLQNQMPAGNTNISGIIKRNKYAPQQVIEENSSMVGGQGGLRLPKLPSLGRQQLDHNGINQQSQAMLPPLGSSNSIASVNGQGLISKVQQNLYQPYIIKPTKLKSMPKPVLTGPNQGISGEKININKYGGSGVSSSVVGVPSSMIQEKILNGSLGQEPLQLPHPIVSRQNHLQSLASGSNASNQPVNDGGKEIKKVIKKRTRVQIGGGAQSMPPRIINATNEGAAEGSAADANGYDN